MDIAIETVLRKKYVEIIKRAEKRSEEKGKMCWCSQGEFWTQNVRDGKGALVGQRCPMVLHLEVLQKCAETVNCEKRIHLSQNIFRSET